MSNKVCHHVKCTLVSFEINTLTPEQIFDKSLSFLGVKKEELFQITKGLQKTYFARHMINAVLKYNTHLSLKEIGNRFSGVRDHSSVSWSLIKVKELSKNSATFRKQYNDLNKYLFN